MKMSVSVGNNGYCVMECWVHDLIATLRSRPSLSCRCTILPSHLPTTSLPPLPVLRPHEVRKRLRLDVVVRSVRVCSVGVSAFHPSIHTARQDWGKVGVTYAPPRARGARAGRPLDRRTPSSARCRTPGSAPRGGRATSGRGGVSWFFCIAGGGVAERRGSCGCWEKWMCLGGGSGWKREAIVEEEWETYSQPDRDVRVNRVARAAGILLVAEGAHDDGVVERAWLGGRSVSMLSFLQQPLNSPVLFLSSWPSATSKLLHWF